MKKKHEAAEIAKQQVDAMRDDEEDVKDDERNEVIASETSDSYEWTYKGINLFYVHQDYLNYKPEDIANIHDRDTLDRIKKLYNPPTCPFYEEEFEYLNLMQDAIYKQYEKLSSI